ncbi:unnamed protein product [Caenorhabditis angaria]|uniref:Uncharacterized protein n=1 Tax=Caenorhabditis angaria TaxID=860376 RepID=A0A9P1N5A4_9PELO|nr:unnamed protein product [Caenorhabditis angaria]
MTVTKVHDQLEKIRKLSEEFLKEINQKTGKLSEQDYNKKIENFEKKAKELNQVLETVQKNWHENDKRKKIYEDFHKSIKNLTTQFEKLKNEKKQRGFEDCPTTLDFIHKFTQNRANFNLEAIEIA